MTTTTTGNDPVEALPTADFAFARRAWADAAPTLVHEPVSDVSAISRWRPDAYDVAFGPEATPWTGAWFSDRDRRADRVWTSRFRIVRAGPGTGFGFLAEQR